MDSEEEQQCFAEHVACLDAPYGIVLFLVPEAALHYRGPEGPDNPSRFLEVSGFFFGPWAFSDETRPLQNLHPLNFHPYTLRRMNIFDQKMSLEVIFE